MLYLTPQDYVRAGTVSPVSSDIVISGSYDKTVNVYDTRSPDPVMSVNHGSPVESVLCLPSGGIFVTGGKFFLFYFNK